MKSRARVVALGVGVLLLLGCTAAVAVPVPNPDPCAYTGTASDAKILAYEKCRFDRLEKAIPGNQTVTTTATVTRAPVTNTVTATATVTAPANTVTVTATQPSSPTSSTPTSSTPTSSTTTTTPPAATGFPTAATAGVPAGWTPATSRSGFTVTTAGAVVENMRITGTLLIDAPNVTVRNVEVVGGTIYNFPGPVCRNGLVVENTTIKRGAQTSSENAEAIGPGGYTARNVKLDGVAEGFRVGGKSSCGPVVIENSYALITSPDICNDWHGDGVQGYDGAAVTIRNVNIDFVQRANCGGTAPFFYPVNQGNTSVDIDGLLVNGGGYPFRDGMPGPVKNLNIVRGSWNFGPIDVKCSVVTTWQASLVDLDATGQPVNKTAQPCNTESGT